MASRRGKVDRIFLFISVILIVTGAFIFNSASLGLLAKGSSNYSAIAFSQTVLGLILGAAFMVIVSKLNFKIWQKSAFLILIIAIVLNILVLFPDIGFEHAGARRWLRIGTISLQTSELLKLAFIIYFAAWIAWVKDGIKSFSWGFLPLIVIFAIVATLLLNQPDTDNFIMIVVAGLAMFIAAGGKWRYIFVTIVIGMIGLGFLAYTKPYIKERFNTYFHPQMDLQDASFQVRQSLIAIGSGGLFGRGFGQSVQKFTYLPEPVGDSIFAVAAEEFGFIGSIFLLILFSAFATRGLKIASHTHNTFGRLVIVGIVIMITSQAFVNIGAMLGVIPLSGITLPFVSHGGTSLFITLLEVGIVLSISRVKGT